MLLIIHGLCITLFLALGAAFRKGKGTFLIAGYNTASEAGKEQTDEKKLCKHMAGLMFTLAACWCMIACSELFHTVVLLWMGLGLFLLTSIGGIMYMSTGSRLKK